MTGEGQESNEVLINTIFGLVSYTVSKLFEIAHFTVTVGNEAGVDLVLIQPFLLYYVNHVVVM